MKAPIVAILLTLAFVPPLYAQTAIPSKFKRAVKRELGGKYNYLFHGDIASFRSSSFSGPVTPLIQKLITQKVKNKCAKQLSPSNVDHVVFVGLENKKKKGKGAYVALSGSFSASRFMACIAKVEKLTKATFRGYPAYKNKKGEFYYTPSMGSFVAIGGAYKKTLHPRKGVLGRAQLSKLASTRFWTLVAKDLAPSEPFKHVSGYGTLGAVMRFKLTLTAHSVVAAKQTITKTAPFLKNPMLKPVTKTLKMRRTGKVIKVDYTMDQSQLRFIITALSGIMKSKSKP